jgi:hypothetical protein
MSGKANNNRRRLILLALGAVTGLVLAYSGLVDRWSTQPGELPDDAVARVNGQVISVQRYQQSISDLAADRRAPLESSDHQFVLQRLIDEELLILRGIELGLPLSSPEIRKSLAAAVIRQIAVEVEAGQPTDDELRAFYDSDPGFFIAGSRYRVVWLSLPADKNSSLADEVIDRLDSGEPLETVMAETGLERIELLPDSLLPLAKIRDYLGPDVTRKIREMAPGEYTRSVYLNGAWQIAYLAAREDIDVPDFERVKPIVEAEFMRRKGDEALRAELSRLRQSAEISVNPDHAGSP